MESSSTRVLLVEDEPSDALCFRRSLRSANGSAERFEVRHASTLAQGLEQLGRDRVDVLLLDLWLPDSEGPGTIARLRERDPRVPLVVVTGCNDPELVAGAFAAGADEYLVKDDLPASVLRRTIRHAIERRRVRSRPDGAAPAAIRESPAEELAALHDLKNLHTCILGNAQLLHDEAAGSEFVRRRAEALLGAARIAARLTWQLFAGPGGEEPSPPVKLSEVVQDAEPLLRAVVPERVELRLALEQGLAEVHARVEPLRRVLLELIVNAVEAIGEEPGAIEVRTGSAVLDEAMLPDLVAPSGISPGPHVWLEVRDSGCGFDADAGARLLERGFSTKGPGRGHGLSHLRQVLGEHRAALLARGRPRAGSSFRIHFPAGG